MFIGTLYPLFMDALGMGKLSVGPPYFEAVFVPLMALTILMMGFGALARWKQSSMSELVKRVRWGFAGAVILAILLPLIFRHWTPMIALGLLLSFWDGRECSDCLSRPTLPAVQHACYRGSRVATLPLAIASSPRGSIRRIPKIAARTIVLNSQSQELYERVLGRHVDLVPNFVPQAASTAVARGWVYVGRLGTEKGIDRLLRNWPQGQPLDVIGDGELAEQVAMDVSARPEINALGLLPRQQLLGILASYRGVVVPSVCGEGLPTIVLEALARGVPAIMSTYVSAADQMSADGTAVIYDPMAGAEDLLRALNLVVTRGTEMRKAAQLLHAREYAPEIWQGRIDSIYDDIASRR